MAPDLPEEHLELSAFVEEVTAWAFDLVPELLLLDPVKSPQDVALFEALCGDALERISDFEARGVAFAHLEATDDLRFGMTMAFEELANLRKVLAETAEHLRR